MVRVVDRLQVGDVTEHERALEVDGSLECDLRDLATRRAEPALAHQNATVSPGLGRDDLDAGRGELAERVRRSRQQAEGPVMTRHDSDDAEQLDRDRGLARAHREVVADREDGHVRRVDAPDQ